MTSAHARSASLHRADNPLNGGMERLFVEVPEMPLSTSTSCHVVGALIPNGDPLL